jgi:hypothetical protein
MSEPRILKELDNTKFYRTVDSIDKLKLRVILKQVGNAQHPLIESNALLEFKLWCRISFNDVAKIDGGGWESSTASSVGLLAPETLVVQWQKKVYGPEYVTFDFDAHWFKALTPTGLAA